MTYELGEGTNLPPYMAEGGIIEHPDIALDQPRRKRNPRAPTKDLVISILDRDSGTQEEVRI